MAKAEKAPPPLPPAPAELWHRDGSAWKLDIDADDARRAAYGHAVSQVTRDARRARLVANELEAAAERMQFDQANPDCVPGRPQRSYNAFQLVSIGLQVFLVVAVLTMAARMLRPTPVETRSKPSAAVFEPAAMPE